MKTFTNRKARQLQAGFTLVELMIVVAIIGILASIAIPNYQKYQAKARTSEGKIQLAAAYTAQKSFFIEYASYTGCIGAAGYAPDLGTTAATAQRYYAIGVQAATVAATTCGNNGTTGCGAAWGNGNPTCASLDGTTTGGPPPVANGTYWSANRVANPGAGNGNAASIGQLPVTTASSTSFIIGASGNINPSTATTYDQWTINEGKVVTQSNVGY